jgi:hypothetical protein
MFLKVKKKHINRITASIVLYNENLETLKKTIDSFLRTPLDKKLYLIDNSATNKLESYFKHPEIDYYFVGKNIGFGKAHNLVLNKINSKFHLILNPDVVFEKDIISILIKELEIQKNVAFITPKIVYPNGDMQFVCRRNPTFFDLLNRKLKISKRHIYKNEYRNLDSQIFFYPEFIHGCFMLFNTEDFKIIEGFDERYFLYMEDADLCRKIYKINKKILFYPKTIIEHQHQQGSSKNLYLFFRHLSSAIKYFLKWGL